MRQRPTSSNSCVRSNAGQSTDPARVLLRQCSSADTCLNLNVLWWKAIAGNRRGTPSDDGGLAFDLLPPVTRTIVRWPLCLAFPNLHHQNVALRTAFIDRVVCARLARAAAAGHRVRLVSLGAGFDTRSLRLAGAAGVGCAAEIDLPSVVAQKRALLGRLTARRSALGPAPVLLPADLNSRAEAVAALRAAMALPCAPQPGAAEEHVGEHVIFVCEALMIYLDDAAAERLVALCRDAARGRAASLCFADRLPGVPGGDRALAGAALPPSTPSSPEAGQTSPHLSGARPFFPDFVRTSGAAQARG